MGCSTGASLRWPGDSTGMSLRLMRWHHFWLGLFLPYFGPYPSLCFGSNPLSCSGSDPLLVVRHPASHIHPLGLDSREWPQSCLEGSVAVPDKGEVALAVCRAWQLGSRWIKEEYIEGPEAPEHSLPG